jgi:tight adherence protein B
MIALLLGSVALFGALLIVTMALVGPRVRRRHLASELHGRRRSGARDRIAELGTQATALAERALERNGRDRRVGELLDRAAIDMRPPEFVAVVAGSAIGAAILGLLLGGILVGLVLAAMTVAAFFVVVAKKGKARREKFDTQLGDTLQLLAGGLRAGHSLPQAIDALVQESEAPTSDEFRRVLFELQLGHSLPEAMASLAGRVKSEDFDWVVQAITIQRDVGGDLAELLDNVTSTIRDRTRVRRQIDTLTAEGRLSAVILFCLPLAMFVYMAFANPTYLGELTSSFAGGLMLAVGGTLLVVGGLWLRRIIRLVY